MLCRLRPDGWLVSQPGFQQKGCSPLTGQSPQGEPFTLQLIHIWTLGVALCAFIPQMAAARSLCPSAAVEDCALTLPKGTDYIF